MNILGSGIALPSNLINNDHKKFSNVGIDNNWIESRSGIKQRYDFAQNETNCKLATIACLNALKDSNIDINTIDLLICASITPDDLNGDAPTIASNISPNIFGFDIRAACNGYIVALITAIQFLKSNKYRRCIVVGVDSITRFINWEDKKSNYLFGVGAGALIIELNENLPFEYKLNSRGSSEISMVYDNNKSNYDYFRMEGGKIYNFVIEEIPVSINDILIKSNVNINQIDYFIFHQANIRILKEVSNKMNIDWNKFLYNIDNVANTSAASIPILIHENIKSGKLENMKKIILSGFGGGLSWGVIYTQINNKKNNLYNHVYKLTSKENFNLTSNYLLNDYIMIDSSNYINLNDDNKDIVLLLKNNTDLDVINCIIKDILNCKNIKNIIILINNLYFINENDDINPENYIIRSLIYSLNDKMKQTKFMILDIDNNFNINDINAFINYKAKCNEISIRKNISYTHEWSRYNTIFDNSNCLIKGTHIVTGGLGALGKLVSKWLVSKGAEHIIVLGRDISDKKSVYDYIKGNNIDCIIDIISLDICDYNSVYNLIKSCNNLSGIFHIAGMYELDSIENLNTQNFLKIISSKKIGTDNLIKACENIKIDFFILFSSISATLGCHKKNVAYSAGNSYLIGCAQKIRKMKFSKICSSLQLGQVSDIGMIKQMNEKQIDAMKKIGYIFIDFNECIELLGNILSHESIDDIILCPMDWNKYSENYKENIYSFVYPILEPRVKDIKLKNNNCTDNLKSVLGSNCNINNTLIEIGIDSLDIIKLSNIVNCSIDDNMTVYNLYKLFIIQIINNLLNIELSDIDQSLSGIGIDSLSIITLNNYFNVELSDDITIYKMFNIIINKLNNHELNNHELNNHELNNHELNNHELTKLLIDIHKNQLNIFIEPILYKYDTTNINIIGCKSQANQVIRILADSNINIEKIYDNDILNVGKELVNGYKVYSNIIPNSINCVIAIGQNEMRKKIVESLNVNYSIVIHKNTRIDKSATILEGCMIEPAVHIGDNVKIGKHCIINTGAIIAHDVIIQDYAFIGAGCIIGGMCKIGEGSVLGMGTIIAPNRYIGNWSTTMIGSIVISNIPDSVHVGGNPASIYKKSNITKIN
jgi:3-oxoacyl-[acyl-carrier-protein] synthase-3